MNVSSIPGRGGAIVSNKKLRSLLDLDKTLVSNALYCCRDFSRLKIYMSHNKTTLSYIQ